jgi:hypothetical protein
LPWLLSHISARRATTRNLPIENLFPLQNLTRPSWHPLDHPTGRDRFRKIFRDQWDRYSDLRLADEVPFDQQVYVRDIIQRMMLCRDSDGVRPGLSDETTAFGWYTIVEMGELEIIPDHRQWVLNALTARSEAFIREYNSRRIDLRE